MNGEALQDNSVQSSHEDIAVVNLDKSPDSFKQNGLQTYKDTVFTTDFGMYFTDVRHQHDIKDGTEQLSAAMQNTDSHIECIANSDGRSHSWYLDQLSIDCFAKDSNDQIYVLKGELEFTKQKLMKEIELSMLRNCEKRKTLIKFAELKIFWSQLCTDRLNQCSRIVYRLHHKVLITRAFYHWSNMSFDQCMMMLRNIAIGSRNPDALKALPKLRRTLRNNSASVIAASTIVAATGFRLFAVPFLHYKQHLLSRWFDYVHQEIEICRKRLLFELRNKARKSYITLLTVFTYWLRPVHHKKSPFRMETVKRLRSRLKLSRRTFIAWSSYLTVQIRLFEAGSWKFGKYLTNLIKSGFENWKSHVSDRCCQRIYQESMLERAKEKLFLHAFLLWRIETHKEAAAQVETESVTDTIVRHNAFISPFKVLSDNFVKVDDAIESVHDRQSGASLFPATNDISGLALSGRAVYSSFTEPRNECEPPHCCESKNSSKSLRHFLNSWYLYAANNVRAQRKKGQAIERRTNSTRSRVVFTAWAKISTQVERVLEYYGILAHELDARLFYRIWIAWSRATQYSLFVRTRLSIATFAIESSWLELSFESPIQDSDIEPLKNDLVTCLQAAKLSDTITEESEGSCDCDRNIIVILDMSISEFSKFGTYKDELKSNIATAGKMDSESVVINSVRGRAVTLVTVNIKEKGSNVSEIIDDLRNEFLNRAYLRTTFFANKPSYRVLWVGLPQKPGNSAARSNIAISPVRTGSKTARICISDGYNSLASEILANFPMSSDKLASNGLSRCEGAMVSKVTDIKIRHICKKVNRHSIFLVRACLSVWKQKTQEELEDESQRICGGNYAAVMKLFLHLWRGYVRSSKQKWSRRTYNIHQISTEFLAQASSSTPPVLLSKSMRYSMFQCVVPAFNAWSMFARATVRDVAAIQRSKSSRHSSLIRKCISGWRMYYGSRNDLIERKNLAIATRSRCFLRKSILLWNQHAKHNSLFSKFGNIWQVRSSRILRESMFSRWHLVVAQRKDAVDFNSNKVSRSIQERILSTSVDHWLVRSKKNIALQQFERILLARKSNIRQSETLTRWHTWTVSVRDALEKFSAHSSFMQDILRQWIGGTKCIQRVRQLKNTKSNKSMQRLWRSWITLCFCTKASDIMTEIFHFSPCRNFQSSITLVDGVRDPLKAVMTLLDMAAGNRLAKMMFRWSKLACCQRKHLFLARLLGKYYFKHLYKTALSTWKSYFSYEKYAQENLHSQYVRSALTTILTWKRIICIRKRLRNKMLDARRKFEAKCLHRELHRMLQYRIQRKVSSIRKERLAKMNHNRQSQKLQFSFDMLHIHRISMQRLLCTAQAKRLLLINTPFGNISLDSSTNPASGIVATSKLAMKFMDNLILRNNLYKWRQKAKINNVLDRCSTLLKRSLTMTKLKDSISSWKEWAFRRHSRMAKLTMVNKRNLHFLKLWSFNFLRTFTLTDCRASFTKTDALILCLSMKFEEMVDAERFKEQIVADLALAVGVKESVFSISSIYGETVVVEVALDSESLDFQERTPRDVTNVLLGQSKDPSSKLFAGVYTSKVTDLKSSTLHPLTRPHNCMKKSLSTICNYWRCIRSELMARSYRKSFATKCKYLKAGINAKSKARQMSEHCNRKAIAESITNWKNSSWTKAWTQRTMKHIRSNALQAMRRDVFLKWSETSVLLRDLFVLRVNKGIISKRAMRNLSLCCFRTWQETAYHVGRILKSSVLRYDAASFKLEDNHALNTSACFLHWCQSICQLKNINLKVQSSYQKSVQNVLDDMHVFLVIWRFSARSKRLNVVSGIRVMSLRLKNMKSNVMTRWGGFSCYIRFLRKTALLVQTRKSQNLKNHVIRMWQNSLTSQHMPSFLLNSIKDVHRSYNSNSANNSQNSISYNKLADRTEEASLTVTTMQPFDETSGWKNATKAILSRDAVIAKHEEQLKFLREALRQKDNIILQREQSISIRDRWLEQISFENQQKEDSALAKELQELRLQLKMFEN